MMNELVGQFLQSGTGADLVKELVSKGLSSQQVTHAVTATAEGALEHGASLTGQQGSLDIAGLAGSLMGGGNGGGVLGALSGMMGGSGGAAAPAAGGGLGSILGGLMGGGTAAPTGNALGGLVAPIATLVAQKTGLDPAMAQMVVSVALPKVMAMLSGGAAAPSAPAAGGGAADLLSSLMR